LSGCIEEQMVDDWWVMPTKITFLILLSCNEILMSSYHCILLIVCHGSGGGRWWWYIGGTHAVWSPYFHMTHQSISP